MREEISADLGISTECFNGKAASTAKLKIAFENVLDVLLRDHPEGGHLQIQWLSDGFRGFKHCTFVNIGMRVCIKGVASNSFANIRIM
jgi:hypothetical protein